MTNTHPAVDPDHDVFGVLAIAAAYYTLNAARDVIQIGQNDGRANEVTERWLEQIAEKLDSEIEIAISRLNDPACSAVDNYVRLFVLMDRANRCGNLEEVARLAASVKRGAA
jgi:hypothetical protein